ncbi:MAG: rhodanese-like domain-containing protein [Oscillospiraceae bacterium]|nr:rhodanese-like domain-containing protein [Oscillospiraceae bacterium]
MGKNIFLLVVCIMFLRSCGANADKNPALPIEDASDDSAKMSAEGVYRKISAEEAREMMESSESYILLDVRTEEEYRENRIGGAMLLPDYEITKRAELELPDKNAVILVYCRSGRRSENAARELAEMGYTNVYDFGGIFDWPYETVGG